MRDPQNIEIFNRATNTVRNIHEAHKNDPSAFSKEFALQTVINGKMAVIRAILEDDPVKFVEGWLEMLKLAVMTDLKLMKEKKND